MNNQHLFQIIIYNNCNEIVQSIDFNKMNSSVILPNPFNNVKFYINPQISELYNLKEKFLLSNDNKYVLGLENYTINNKIYYKFNVNKSLFFSFVEYLMNNITYDKKTYIFNNTTELKFPIYKIEFINKNEKIILIHSADNLNELNYYSKKSSNTNLIINQPINSIKSNVEDKDYIFTLIYENNNNIVLKTILILNKYTFLNNFLEKNINEKNNLTEIYEPIGTKIIQTILNQSLINNSYTDLCKTINLQEEIYKKNMLIQEQKIKQLEEDTKNIKSINDLHKELISNINTTMSMISKKYEKTYKDCEDSIKQQQEIFQEKVNSIENECSIINPEQITKEELIVKYNNLLKVLLNKNSKISNQEQDIKKLQEKLNKYSKENLILKSEKDKLNEQIKSSPRTPRFNMISPPLSPRLDNKILDNKMDELIKSINSISNNSNKDNIIKNQQEQINKLNETMKEKDDRIKGLINSCESAYKLVKNKSIEETDIIEIYKELLKEYIEFINSLIKIVNIEDKNITIKLKDISNKILQYINIETLQDIKTIILYIEKSINIQFKDRILIDKNIIETLINGIINIYDFIRETIKYIAKLNNGQQINEEVLNVLFNKYDENCKNINLIIKPLIQNYLPNMKNLLLSDSDEYDIDDYDDSDFEGDEKEEETEKEDDTDLECNEDSYDEDSETDTETDYDSEINEDEINEKNIKDFNEINRKEYVNKQNNIIVSAKNFNPKYGQVYIKPVQTNEKTKIQQGNYQINRQIKRKNKIKTVNTQAAKLFNMLINSYNKQNIYTKQNNYNKQNLKK